MIGCSHAFEACASFKEDSRMSEAYIGEIRSVGFNFPPVGWASCSGQLLAISDNPALFNLIGTTYGGNGQTTFALPNLMGRIPVHQGSNGTTTYVLGELGGSESVTIGIAQYPSHNHLLSASANPGGSPSPLGNTVGDFANVYRTVAPTNPPTPMNGTVLGLSGGGNQPHENRQPYLVINWIISLYGVYPTPS
jgi:microcystin-dependent protein